MSSVGKIVVLKPGYYWFTEEVPRIYGEAFEITVPTKCKVIKKKSPYWYVVKNIEPIHTQIKTFSPRELLFYVEASKVEK